MVEAQPNIILIITDQQRFDTIGALGFDYMDTPNLDRLVNEGVSFDQCHITAPSCAPARASLFTGYYPHVTGVMQNADQWRHSWVEDLAASGYHCVNIGKMHTYPWETPLGFHERYVVENKDRYLEGRYYFDEWDKGLRARGLIKQQREQYRQRPDYRERMGALEWELPEETQSDMFVGDMATWWLETHPQEQPLFLQIGFPGPHPPYDPIPRYAEPYLAKDLPLPNVTQAELDSQPAAFKQLREHNFNIDHDSVVHLPNPTREQLHRLRAYYLANMTMIDEKVGQILGALDAQGYLENSIVIFTSDHGDCLGDHGHIQKWTMYDIITRVPAIVWSPGRFAGGRRLDDLCQWMDIGATILDIAGIDRPETMQAESLAPALNGEDWNGRDYVFAEHPADGIYEGAYMTMVRSRDWKLVHFVDQDEGQLFDLKADSDEAHNLWDDPVHADKKRELLAVMLNWRVNSAYQTRHLFRAHR
jgi:arylsulfatase A-like enzyme